MNAVLDDSQLLILSIFAYRLDCVEGIRAGLTFEEAARLMENSLIERQIERGDAATDTVSQLMSYREWFAVLACIRTTPALANLVLDNVQVDSCRAKMMLLSDAERNAYAVFSGSGAGEWEDNAIAAYERESAQQLSALAWILGTCGARGYRTVTACGHSKGGNKAFYLAVRAPGIVDRAVGFDAQGFSSAFVQAYGDDILANTDKIWAYALDNDYVNGLLANIALHSRRIYVDGSHISNPVAYHSPFSMFVPYHGATGTLLELGGSVPQGTFGRAFREFSIFVHKRADDWEYQQMCRCIGSALENLLVPNRTDAERQAYAIEIGSSEGFKILFGYLRRFFSETIQDIGPADLVAFLLPKGQRGATVLDDFAISALQTASGVLKWLTR